MSSSTAQLNKPEIQSPIAGRPNAAVARIESYFTGLIFLSILCIFSLGTALECIGNKSLTAETEKRTLAPMPRLDQSTAVNDFITAFEQYFNDRLPLRLQLTGWSNYLAYKFGVSKNPDVLIGNKDWLFYNRVSAGTKDASLNSSSFSDTALRLWVKSLDNRRLCLAKHGIGYLLVLAPEKGSIYPEYLPQSQLRHPGTTRLEQLQNRLKSSDVQFVDARRILSAEKNKGKIVYLRTDSHWNDMGAQAVATEILRALSSSYSVNVPDGSAKSFRDERFTGDLANLLGLQTYLHEQAPALSLAQARATVTGGHGLSTFAEAEYPHCHTTVPDKQLAAAYILRDSFCSRLAPVISEGFSDVNYEWTHEFDESKIVAAKPKIVIEELAERHLYEGYPDNLPTIVSRDQHDTDAAIEPFKSEYCQHALYEDGVSLSVAPVERTTSGIILKFLWQAKAPTKLDCKYAFQALDESGNITGGHDNFRQDFFARRVPSGGCWLDEVEMPLVDCRGAKNIGFIRCKESGGEVSLREGARDSGNGRLLITIK